MEGMRAIADVFDDLDATAVTGNALEGTQKTMDKLIKAIAATPVESEMMNAPRPGKLEPHHSGSFSCSQSRSLTAKEHFAIRAGYSVVQGRKS